MAAEERNGDWRLEKYVAALRELLTEIQKSPSKPTQDVLTDYTRKVNFLVGLLEAEKLPSTSDKALATQLLRPGQRSGKDSAASRDLHLHTRARYQADVKTELIGTKGNEHSSLRLRKSTSSDTTNSPQGGVGDDIDTVLKHHHEVQEKLVEGMLHLVTDLKENAKVIGKIAQDDTSKLSSSSKMADVNYDKLKVESSRLEAHVKKSFNCWIWVMLIVVCVTFVWMVIFMKMFPKR
ncbi:Vesicle transport protein USE1 [Lamellibrachia satsuma]|nr:Vesicle transport protein USE1 [Lamellibrachia satsuma]